MTQLTQQGENSPRPRATARINPKLEKNLATYLTAASAAGVSLMVLSNTSEAKVVYTPANITGTFDTPVPVDINGDGIADVNFTIYPLDKAIGMFVNAPSGNGVRLTGYDAAAGFFGVPVGPGEKFGGSFVPMYYKVFGYGNSSSYGAFGPWANVTNRYLGVKFVIAGTIHFGWVRMTTSKTANPVITGYAYETIPNVSIKDGAISGPTVRAESNLLAPAHEPTSLGLLALGAPGLSAWRREES